jgi:hypothetical protein
VCKGIIHTRAKLKRVKEYYCKRKLPYNLNFYTKSDGGMKGRRAEGQKGRRT